MIIAIDAAGIIDIAEGPFNTWANCGDVEEGFVIAAATDIPNQVVRDSSMPSDTVIRALFSRYSVARNDTDTQGVMYDNNRWTSPSRSRHRLTEWSLRINVTRAKLFQARLRSTTRKRTTGSTGLARHKPAYRIYLCI